MKGNFNLVQLRLRGGKWQCDVTRDQSETLYECREFRFPNPNDHWPLQISSKWRRSSAVLIVLQLLWG